MRDLHDVRRHHGVAGRVEQRPLLPRAEVAEREERRTARRIDPDRDARRVALPPRRPPIAGRPQDGPGGVADRERVAGGEAADLRPRLGEPLDDPLAPGLLRVGDGERVDSAEKRVGGAVVVVVEVREDEEVEPFDAEPVEAGVDRLGLGTGVDERDRLGRADEQRVALPDVARGVPPVAGPLQRVAHLAADDAPAPRDDHERDDHGEARADA